MPEPLPDNFRQHYCYSLSDMHAIAENRGGKCLSAQYTSVMQKLQWQCACGYIWDAVPFSILRGHWCPKCGRKKSESAKSFSLEDIKQKAQELGGKCLSAEYENKFSLMSYECSNGHKWESAARNILQGYWCQECRKYTLTIEDIKKEAETHSWKCLSMEYKGSNNKLNWSCSAGHKISAFFTRLKKNGFTCSICRKIEKQKTKDELNLKERFKNLSSIKRNGNPYPQKLYKLPLTSLKKELQRGDYGLEFCSISVFISRDGYWRDILKFNDTLRFYFVDWHGRLQKFDDKIRCYFMDWHGRVYIESVHRRRRPFKVKFYCYNCKALNKTNAFYGVTKYVCPKCGESIKIKTRRRRVRINGANWESF